MCITHFNWLSGDSICEDKSDDNHTAGPGCPLSVSQGAPLVGAARGVWRGARRKAPGASLLHRGCSEGLVKAQECDSQVLGFEQNENE